jgi:hypothetical protein
VQVQVDGDGLLPAFCKGGVEREISRIATSIIRLDYRLLLCLEFESSGQGNSGLELLMWRHRCAPDPNLESIYPTKLVALDSTLKPSGRDHGFLLVSG